MENEMKYKKASRTASIITAIGALLMIVAFVAFIIINRHKSEKLESKQTELILKDSINEALHDTIKTLKPIIEPVAYAIPTGKISHPEVSYMPKESPEFIYYLCLNVADSLKNKVSKVDYFLNDPTFKQKHYISENLLDSFKVSYRGWGCIEDVSVFVTRTDNSNDTLNFRMCDNLKLRGQSVSVH